MDIKEKLLAPVPTEPAEVQIGEYTFRIRRLTGKEEYDIMNWAGQMSRQPLIIKDGETLVALPETVHFAVLYLSRVVIEPQLTPEEWGLVFQRKFHVFNLLAIQLMRMTNVLGVEGFFPSLYEDTLNNA